jgi:DNA-binding CsgD family transcriptional regulator
VSYYLGLLATLMGDWEDAERRFAAALAMNERWGIRPYVAHTQYDWAAMLVRRGNPDDRERALDLTRAAVDLAEQIGMTRVATRAHALIEQLTHAAAPSANELGLTAREIEVLQMLVAGQTSREIAASLFISPRTVERHVTNIYNKIGVNSRAAATAFAIRHGLYG